MWLTYIVISAITLSFFDIFRKASIKDNPIWHILAISNAFGAVYVTIFYACAGWIGDAASVTAEQCLLLFAKSVLNSLEWCFAFYAYRALPISTYVPIGASSPLWTFIGAMCLFHEIPSPLQGVGMVVIFIGYWLFATAGKAEGVNIFKSKGVIACFIQVLLGAGSSLFDKYLLQKCGISAKQMQFWFMVDMAVIAAVIAFALTLFNDHIQRRPPISLTWRKYIPLIGLAIAVSDFLYFEAVAMPDTMISIVALLRRLNVVTTFILGVFFFHERNFKSKAIALAAIIIGAVILSL